ncbi:MAG: hypothetical protein ACPMAG_02680 [Limisphaerales bacterium]
MKRSSILKLVLIATLISGIGFVLAGREAKDSDNDKPDAKKAVKKEARDSADKKSKLKKEAESEEEKPDVDRDKKKEAKEDREAERPIKERREVEAREKSPPVPLPKIREESMERARIAIENLRAAGFPDIAARVEREIDMRFGGMPKPPIKEPLKDMPRQPVQPFKQPHVVQPMPMPPAVPMAREEFKRLENQIAELKEQLKRLDERLDKLAQERR